MARQFNPGDEIIIRFWDRRPVEQLPPGYEFHERVYVGAGGYANNEFVVLLVAREDDNEAND